MKKTADSQTPKKMTDENIVQKIIEYREVSKRFRHKRLSVNRNNWDCYNLRQNYRHKRKGQSKEFIPKVAVGIEHLVSTIFTGLTNRNDDWFSVTWNGEKDEVFDSDLVRELVKYFANEAMINSFIANSIKYAGLDGIVTAKVASEFVSIPRFSYENGKLKDNSKSKLKKKEFKRFKIFLDLIDFIDFYEDPAPNPSGPLYKMQVIKRDYHDLVATAKQYPDIYDINVINQIKDGFVMEEEEQEKREKRNEEYERNYGKRKKVTITEFYGTILDDDGNASDDLTNIVCAIANDKYLIRKPEKFPSLDGKDPFVKAGLLEVEDSIYPKAFLDAAVKLNRTLNEEFNLITDGLFDAIKGIKQFRRGVLTNQAQVSGSVPSGTTLEIDESTPIGVYAIEKVPTGNVPSDAFSFYRYTEGLVDEAQYQNELKVGGIPAAGTKATVAALADSSISGVFAGLVVLFEDRYVTQILNKIWLEILQNMQAEQFLENELMNILGEQKAIALSEMSIEERFARGANFAKFKVRGISGSLSKVREFQKIDALLGRISSSPEMYQAFKEDFSFKELLSQIISASGLRVDQIKKSDDEKAQERLSQQTAQLIAASINGSQQPKTANGRTELSESNQETLLEGNANAF